MPLSPEEEAALNDAMGLLGGGPSTPPGAGLQPQVPPQKRPNLREAEADLQRAASERFRLTQPGPEGQREAVELVQEIRDKPEDIPAEPTLLQQTGRSLLPKQVVGDDRPMSGADIAKKLAALVATMNPTSIPAAAARGLQGQDPTKLIPEDEKGIPQEPGVLYALRVLGSAIPAAAVETIGRMPLPDPSKAKSFETVLDAFLEPTTVGEAVTGAEITSSQRVRRDNPVADWYQGVMERIEEGRGTEADFEAGFRERFGQQWADTGWWLGLLVDVATNWEGGLAKSLAMPVKVGSTVRTLGHLDPELSASSRLWTALRKNEVEAGEYIGGKLVAGLENGKVSIDDLPADIRHRMEEVAQNEYDMSLVELAKLEGIGAPRTELAADPEYIRVQDELAAAQKAAGDVNKRRGRNAGTVLTPEQRAKRARLPDFDKPIYQAHEYWTGAAKLNADPARPELGYNTPRGDAFRRFADHAEQTMDKPEYVLRSAKGDVIGNPAPFDQAIVIAARRRAQGIEGDSIWWQTRRPVAHWAKTGKERMTTSFHFASPAEENFVKRLRSAGDPAVWPARARQIKAERLVNQTAGSILGDALTRAPGPSVSAKTKLGHVAQEATRLAVRDKLGTDRLEQLATGAFVAKGERAVLNKRVEKLLGMDSERALYIMKHDDLLPLEGQTLGSVARRLGVPIQGPVTKLEPATWRALYNRALEHEAGVLADVRYRVAGTEPFLQRMFSVLQDAHLDRKVWGPIQQRILTRGPLAWFAEGFLEDKLGKLPSAVQGKLRELKAKLERNADDLTDEFQRSKGQSIPLRLLEVTKGHIPVLPSDLDLGDAIRKAPLATPTGAADAKRLVAQLQREWRGPRPPWLDSPNEGVRTYGAIRWARDAEEVGAELGRKWVASHLLALGREVEGTTLAEHLSKNIPTELGVRVYRELYQQGLLTGPALGEALSKLNLGPLKLEPDKAVVAHALASRHEKLVQETMEDLIGTGFAVRSSDPRGQALAAVLNNTHRSWNDALKRWEYAYPEAQVTWALGRLRDWGIEPGAGTVTLPRGIGGRQVTLPKYLADDIAEMVSAGSLDSRSVYGKTKAGEALNTLTRAFKEWTTHGILMPNPAYFTGQLLGMWPVLVTTRGLSGAASVAGQLIRHPLVTGELMKRLGGEGMPIFVPRDPSAFLLRTDAGHVYTLDELETLMRRWGVHETKTSFETEAGFRDVIARESGVAGVLNPLNLRLPAARMQQVIRKTAGSFDLAGRIGVFLDALKRGATPDVAAREARESLLDFRNMTAFERRWMRMIFTFYAFMRKNSDAYIRALFANPARVLGQMRLAEASITSSGLTEIELGAITNQDLARLTVYDDDEVVSESGRPHSLYRMNRLQSTPLGVTEWLAMMQSLVAPAMLDEEGTRALVGQTNPLGQTLSIWTLGRKLDREFDSARQNRIPPVLLDSFLGPLFRETFGVGPLPLGDQDDPLTADEDASRELGAGKRAVWAAGAARGVDPATAELQRKLWQTFQTWLGRPLGTLQQASEALPEWVPVPPSRKAPPHLTEEEASLAFALGLRFRPALNEREATRRALRRREAAFGEAQEEVQLPDSSVRR